MTTISDFQRIRQALMMTDDTQLARFITALKKIFDKQSLRPRIHDDEEQRAILADVDAYFPSPFARLFHRWSDYSQTLDAAMAHLFERIAATREAAPDPETADLRRRELIDAQFQSAETLRTYFELITGCWKQIVHFLPLLFIAMLSRMDDQLLRREVGPQIGRALHRYRAFYINADAKQKEHLQYELLHELIKLFRELSAKQLLNADNFYLFPLMRNGFDNLFPKRFVPVMRMLHEIRNVFVHGDLGQRYVAQVPDHVAPLTKLTIQCLIDIAASLAPISRLFTVSWIEELRPAPAAWEAVTLDFVRLTGPIRRRRRIDSELTESDDNGLDAYHVYLIADDKTSSHEPDQVAAIGTTLDLTPFLVVDRLRTFAAAPEERAVYGLQQYFEQKGQLTFLELGRLVDITRPSKIPDPQDPPTTLKIIATESLLHQMREFKSRIDQFTAQLVLVSDRLPIEAVRTQLWRVSKHHLAQLMDVDRYAETGATLPGHERAELRPIYSEDLFVEPAEAGHLAAFLSSDRRGLIVAGESGAGKSNLLIHHLLGQMRERRLAAFLSARRFATSAFREALLSSLFQNVASAWTGFEAINAFLEDNDEELVIFIDAINEYSGSGGALALLESLILAAGHHDLARCRIIASCRSETWRQFVERAGHRRILDDSVFLSVNGDAIRLGRFDRAHARALYAAYQRKYKLRPVVFEQLSPSVQELIAQPLMMAMIAESYANEDFMSAASVVPSPAAAPPTRDQAPASPRRIPRELDYYALFDRLTDRKTDDAKLLVPNSFPLYRDELPRRIREFCEQLAEIIFERLAGSAAAASGRESVPVSYLNSRPDLKELLQQLECVTVLEAALQTGLIERMRISQRNRDGRMTDIQAFGFFHDQYTQYWLAAAYQQKILGWLDSNRLNDQDALGELIGQLERIISLSVNAPILAGALDHWLRKNLQTFHDDRIGAVIPLLERLAEDGSAATRHQSASLVATLILRGALPPETVYAAVFEAETPALRRGLVASFVDFWPMLSPEAFASFVDACDPDSLERLAVVLVRLFLLAPDQVADYLDAAIAPLALTSLARPRRTMRRLTFLFFFVFWALFTGFDNAPALAAVRRIFRRKLPEPVLDLVYGTERPRLLSQMVRGGIRPALYKVVELVARISIRKFIESLPDSGNDRYFVENDGLVQRDVLAEFLPYIIELHNGQFNRLSLAAGSPFHELATRMLCFRVNSVIGYNALLTLPAVLRTQPWEDIESFIMQVIERRTPAAIFYGTMLPVNLCYSDRQYAERVLALMSDRVIPLLLRERIDCDWSVPFCIAVLDVERLWPGLEQILLQLLAHFERLGDEAACTRFGDHLYKICYCPDPHLRPGRRTVALLLKDRRRFFGPLWRRCSMKVLAAMLTASPATLRELLTASGADDSIMREARNFQSEEIVSQSQLFPYQIAINQFLAWTFASEPRLRRSVIMHFIASMALGRDWPDAARGMRRLLLDVLGSYFGDGSGRPAPPDLTMQELVLAARER